jgi:hypothetical protein
MEVFLNSRTWSARVQPEKQEHGSWMNPTRKRPDTVSIGIIARGRNGADADSAGDAHHADTANDFWGACGRTVPHTSKDTERRRGKYS